MKKHDVAILISVGFLCILLVGNMLVMLGSKKDQVEIIKEQIEIEIEPKACSLNEMVLGQIYEVMGVEYALFDVGRWGEGEILELQFRVIKLNE